MKYRIIRLVGGGFVKDEILDIIKYASDRDIKIIKLNCNSRHRAELQRQPIIEGFNGPMWDGDAVRYEEWEQKTKELASKWPVR